MPEFDEPKRTGQDGLIDLFENLRMSFKRFKLGSVVMLIAAFVVLWTVWTVWFTVQPEGTGIVPRSGKVMRTASPGLHFKIPLGIKTARMVPTGHGQTGVH